MEVIKRKKNWESESQRWMSRTGSESSEAELLSLAAGESVPEEDEDGVGQLPVSVGVGEMAQLTMVQVDKLRASNYSMLSLKMEHFL